MSYGWNDILFLLLSNYADKEDADNISVGDFIKHEGSPIPEFHGFMQLNIGELRKLAQNLQPDNNALRSQ
tara:strand:- start:1703 stop:1912 length:210 start_codon:yes stop_codon:yes gene_type:complete